jgi:hypothetical protein
LDDKFYYIGEHEDMTKFKKFAFASSADHELWCSLVEKAYAKSFGSYFAIARGKSDEALFDLTGAPCQEIKFLQTDIRNGSHKVNGEGMSREETGILFHRILKADEHAFIMTAKSRGRKGDPQKRGIEPGHM